MTIKQNKERFYKLQQDSKSLVNGRIWERDGLFRQKPKSHDCGEVRYLAAVCGCAGEHWPGVAWMVVVLLDLAAFAFLYACVPVSFRPKLVSIAMWFLDDVRDSVVFGGLWLRVWPGVAPLRS